MSHPPLPRGLDLASLDRLAGVGVVLARRTGEVDWSNSSAKQFIGLPPPATPLSSLLDLPQVSWERLATDQRTRPGPSASSSGGAGPSHSVQLRLIHTLTTAPERLVDLFATPVDEHILITITDCTQLASAEAELVELRARLTESERIRARLSDLRAELASDQTPDRGASEMIGESVPLRRVREQVARVASTNTTVLIHGETGSGKELVARSLHGSSGRRQHGFVAVNCAAMPEALLESELFGHERGAFTGADRRKLGKFELADGGTLFLDEVAEMPLTAQAKLLRVLQERVFERVGGTEPVKVDVRLIAATHRDLARQVERGRFREDLYYRLAVFRIDVPALRDRKEDLRSLIEHLHQRVATRMAKPVLPVNERCMRRLMAYAWPGNVRELANAVERATLLCDGSELEIELPQGPIQGSTGSGESSRVASPRLGGAESDEPPTAGDILLDLSLEQLQRLQIVHALERSNYRVFGADGAAVKLEINPRTLLSRMDKFGIPRPRLARGDGERQ